MSLYVVATRPAELADGYPVYIATSARQAAHIAIQAGVGIDDWTDTVAVRHPDGEVEEVLITEEDEIEEEDA